MKDLMKSTEERKRVCVVRRGESGFGFVLCCENSTTDTYVLHVIQASPACLSGLRPGDRVVEINGINVEKETHKEVVQRLQGLKSVELVVSHNNAAEEYFKQPSDGMTVKPLENGGRKLRPKLMKVKKGDKNSFDFFLQTVDDTSSHEEHRKMPLKGHYVARVSEGGAAYKAGLREGNRIIQINGVDVDHESHAFVIEAIKTSQELELLVVDKETDEFFQTYGVCPTSKHLHGEVEFKASPRLNSGVNEKDDCKESCPRVNSSYHRKSISPVSSSTSPPCRFSQSFMTRSTPNLTAVGIGRSKSWGSVESPKFDHSKIRQSAAYAKKKIRKQLSKLERKPSKSQLYKVSLHDSRNVHDDTITDDLETSTVSSTSSHPGVDQLFSQLSMQNPTQSGFSLAVADVNNKEYPLHSYKALSSEQQAPPACGQSESGSNPIQYDSLEELSSVGFNVDLKTLKEHVRKKSSRARHDIVRSKSKLDYSLAHMYVNSY